MKDGTLLIYVREDSGQITDTGVYVAPGVENAVEVGKHLSGELADALVERGFCAVYVPEPEKPAKAASKAKADQTPKADQTKADPAATPDAPSK